MLYYVLIFMGAIYGIAVAKMIRRTAVGCLLLLFVPPAAFGGTLLIIEAAIYPSDPQEALALVFIPLWASLFAFVGWAFFKGVKI